MAKGIFFSASRFTTGFHPPKIISFDGARDTRVLVVVRGLCVVKGKVLSNNQGGWMDK